MYVCSSCTEIDLRQLSELSFDRDRLITDNVPQRHGLRADTITIDVHRYDKKLTRNEAP
jgi:hypothetical protein